MTISRRARHVVIGVVAALMLALAPSGAAIAADDDYSFSDVPETHSFYEHISWMAYFGYIKGYADGTFRPSQPITRGQLAVIMYKYNGADEYFEPPATSPFKDVPTTHTFYKHIAWMADQGLVKGFSDGTFRPSAELTRGQAAVVLFKDYWGPEGEYYEAPSKATFTDVPTTHSFYRHISWLVEEDIAKGFADKTFRPSVSVTRGQTAVFLYNYDDLYWSEIQR